MRNTTDLLSIIRRAGGAVSARDLQRASKKFPKVTDATNALAKLKERGYGDWETRSTGGRPKTVFVLEGRAESDAFPVDTVETDDTMSIAYYGEKWMTKDEIVSAMGLDMTLWRIDKVSCRGWEVTGKTHQGQEIDPETGQLAWLPQQLWKSKNRYIAINLVRRAPKQVQDSILDLLKHVSWPASPSPKRTSPGKSVMELALYDIHLGKYCWGKMTGQPYDLPIATSVFMDAGADMLNRSSQYDIGKIIVPLGHDFFQVDNWLGATTAGTIVESTDDRFSKTFQVGIHAFRFLIDECLKVAPVEIIYVPGNHDRSTSYYLCEVLAGYYDSNKHVEIDIRITTGHKGRKYRKFGVTLLGYIHGARKDTPKDRDLPLLMATEMPDWWAATIDRAWRLAHLHTKRTSIVPVGDIFNGVRVERIPSLTATDAWHYDNGFTGNRRAAEAWIWSYTDGLIHQFPSYAKDTEAVCESKSGPETSSIFDSPIQLLSR
jgi:hypothetical protein